MTSPYIKPLQKSAFGLLCLCLQMGDGESREQLIKTHYMARVGELTTQLQISDSKAVHFHSEVRHTYMNFNPVTTFYSTGPDILMAHIVLCCIVCHLVQGMETVRTGTA